MENIQSNKRSFDQVDAFAPVGQDPKRQKQPNNTTTIVQSQQFYKALTTCPSCFGHLLKPTTLPCGYTVCKSCIPNDKQTCISPNCQRIHTTRTQPNVVLETLQQLIPKNDSTLETLRETFALSTECPICCTRFTTATTTHCGHTFCKNCLVRSLDHQRTCPFCRDTVESCPPPTFLLVDILTHLYNEQDDETDDALSITTDFESETRVPLLLGNLSFPHVKCAIHIFEPRYRLMLRRIMASSRRRFAMCLTRRNRQEGEPAFYEYGVILELMHVQTLPDGRSMIEAVGSHRFKVINFELTDGYHMADIERVDDFDREQEHMLEQQQILTASAMRARQQQVQAQQTHYQQQQYTNPQMPMMIGQSYPATTISRPMARPVNGRPILSSIARPMSARPMSARPMSARPPQQHMMVNSRRSWAQQAHPQTQQTNNRTPWSHMHIQGLSAARPKPEKIGGLDLFSSSNINTVASLMPEKIQKNRQEQSTEEILDDLAEFVEKLKQHKDSHSSNDGLSSWMSALGDPPVLRGQDRDKVIMTWWIVNMMPLGEEEKIMLLAMRSIRERTLLIISWIDRFEDQWSLFLNNGANATSAATSTAIANTNMNTSIASVGINDNCSIS